MRSSRSVVERRSEIQMLDAIDYRILFPRTSKALTLSIVTL